MSGQPHDQLIQAILASKRHAVAHLRSILPPEIARELDFRALRALPTRLVSAEVRGRDTDRLFTVRMRGRPILLYVVYEAQAGPDRWMSWRTNDSSARIWNRFRSEHPRARALPPVLSVVFHTGPRPWRRPPRLADLLDLTPRQRELLRPFLPDAAFLLVDLANESERRVEGRVRRATPLVALATLLLKRRPTDRLLRRFRRWNAHFRRPARQDPGGANLELLINYVLKTIPPVRPEDLRRALPTIRIARSEKSMFSMADKLKRDGRREGRREGLKDGHRKGRKEGLVEGLRAALLLLLQVRFGTVPKPVQVRVANAKAATLERWLQTAASARSLKAALPE